MKQSRRDLFRLAGAAALGLSTASPSAWAQAYPSRPVRIIVATAAGGATDIVARLAAQWLTERLGQSFLVENRPGGGNNVGTEAMVRSQPDGHTLQLASSVNVINTSLYDKLSFDFIADTMPIASFTSSPLAMVISPKVPARSVAEFIAYAKANPGKINMGSGGIGSTGHVTGELFRMMAGIEMVHVPYRGEGPALLDLLGGQVQVVFVTISSTLQYLRAGTLVGLGVTSAGRSDALPDLPAVADTLPGYEATAWNGIVAPKGVPADVVQRLNTEINAGLKDPTFRKRLIEIGALPLGGTPADFRKFIADETEKWAKVVKFAGAKAQ